MPANSLFLFFSHYPNINTRYMMVWSEVQVSYDLGITQEKEGVLSKQTR